jgi:hypothetical protein
MGAGEAPPKTADDYQLQLPDGISMDGLKQDAKFAGFLKGAHSRGLNNQQVSWLLGEFQQRMSTSPDEAEAALRQDFPGDEQLTKALQRSYTATARFSKDPGERERLEAKFGNDPDFIRLMSRIGAEVEEDTQVHAGLSAAETETLESLMSHPAYMNGKHPEHGQVVARARRLYEKRTAGMQG